MSVNKYQPHLFILPEDDANRQVANGFLFDLHLATRSIQVLPEAGGWQAVLQRFQSDHLKTLDRFEQRFMILLIDCDGREDRLTEARKSIPTHLRERVWILGTLTEPEQLRQQLGSYEKIGLALAKDCREETNATWGHELLRHNLIELDRLRERVLTVLFPPRE